MAFLISEDKGGKWGISTVVQANDVHVLVWRQVLLGKKKWSCCTLLQVFQVQISSNVMVYSTEKVVRYQNRPDLRSRSANEIFNTEKKINQRENSCSQPPSSRINVVCTYDRFIMNAIKNCQKERIEINFVLPLCLGNQQPGIYVSCSIHPLKSSITSDGIG
jgi:hypothetical protein